jgi:hypothetical protein
VTLTPNTGIDVSGLELGLRSDEELQEVSPRHAEDLAALQARFRAEVNAGDEAEGLLVLVLRQSIAGPATVRSRRRSIDIDGAPLP